MIKQILSVKNTKLVIELPEYLINEEIELTIKTKSSQSEILLNDFMPSKEKLRELIAMELYGI